MTKTPRVTYYTALVLHAIDQGTGYGFEIMQATGLPAGTVYPILRRCEAGGLLTSHWENQEHATNEGRPRRRHYDLTHAGRTALLEGLERFKTHQRIMNTALTSDPARSE